MRDLHDFYLFTLYYIYLQKQIRELHREIHREPHKWVLDSSVLRALRPSRVYVNKKNNWGILGIEPRASRRFVLPKQSPKARIIPLDHTPLLH